MSRLVVGHLSAWGAHPWCHACQASTVRWHCANRGCRRVTCTTCKAVTICTGGHLSLTFKGVERL